MEPDYTNLSKKLPAGWEELAHEGEILYVNIYTGYATSKFPKKEAKEPTSDEIPEGWVIRKNSQTDRNYYYNPSTNKASYYLPEVEFIGGWVIRKSSQTGRKYYYNPKTQEVSYYLPQIEEIEKASRRSQAAIRGRVARTRRKAEIESSVKHHQSLLPRGWKVVYQHNYTGHVTTEFPVEGLIIQENKLPDIPPGWAVVKDVHSFGRKPIYINIDTGYQTMDFPTEEEKETSRDLPKVEKEIDYEDFCDSLAFRDNDQINFLRKQIYDFINDSLSEKITINNFTELITIDTLTELLYQYDEHFFDGELMKLSKEHGCIYTICWDERCKCVDTKWLGHCTPFEDKKHMLLTFSSMRLRDRIMEMPIRNESSIKYSGLECNDILSCLQLLFEHELVHAIIHCFCSDYGYNNDGPGFYSTIPEEMAKGGHSNTFMSILNSLFGHTNFYGPELLSNDDKIKMIKNFHKSSEEEERRQIEEEEKRRQNEEKEERQQIEEEEKKRQNKEKEERRQFKTDEKRRKDHWLRTGLWL